MSIQNSNSSVTVPTMDDVRKAIKEAIEEHAASRNHPYATLENQGLVTLSNDVDSDSEMTVATSKAVKTANDNADTRLSKGQNGADIPNKEEFVKNLGLEPIMEGLALPVGVPVPWPTEAPPEGWLICNGDSFDTERYPKLALAYPKGVLPDLRGEFIRGLDNGRGIDPHRTLLSKQQATMLPSVYTYKAKAGYKYKDPTTGREYAGILVSPPMSAYETEGTEGEQGFDFRPRDFDEPVNAQTGDSYLAVPLDPGGGGAYLTTFRVRPRNIAFNYIVRAA
ncbi:tail protein [Xenorhabdus mauleonii]|uniref:Phage Tail Collar Domain n=1 Tax=Xenorhabdus mauleonii TaxID=351675 RepID=A0A1I3VPL1_9GAMM|nr:phage tail protein [Xenorhabdus mauleonii]PHM38418.1 tail protein [Xenorhabdus mauleonii]SFJ97344.1 Phage Tail Collar Domain [Xenorhabdus mauleonii]